MGAQSTARHLTALANLLGQDQLLRLQAAHVVVVGVGGVGSWAAEALARSGIGRLTLIDFDVVTESNLNRQVQAGTTTLGCAKVVALANRLREVVPEVAVAPVDEFLTPANAAALLRPIPDAVIDATDDLAAKVALACWARQERRFLVIAGAAGGKQDPTRVRAADLAQAIQDPLLAKLRARLRRDHGFPRLPRKMGLRVIFSDEPMVRRANCDGRARLACAGYGSIVTVTATVGLAAAAQVIAALRR